MYDGGCNLGIKFLGIEKVAKDEAKLQNEDKGTKSHSRKARSSWKHRYNLIHKPRIKPEERKATTNF